MEIMLQPSVENAMWQPIRNLTNNYWESWELINTI